LSPSYGDVRVCIAYRSRDDPRGSGRVWRCAGGYRTINDRSDGQLCRYTQTKSSSSRVHFANAVRLRNRNSSFLQNIAHPFISLPSRDYILVCGKNVNFSPRSCCFILCVKKVQVFDVLLPHINLNTFGDYHFHLKRLHGPPH